MRNRLTLVAVITSVGLSILALVTVGPRPTQANGGKAIFEERVGAYSVYVSVRPPEPQPGVVAISIVIEGYVSVNGPQTESLAPVPTELWITAGSPSGSVPDIARHKLTPLLPGASHYDVTLALPVTGEWTLLVDSTGPLAPESIGATVVVTGESELTGALKIAAGIGMFVALGAMCLVILRRRGLGKKSAMGD